MAREPVFSFCIRSLHPTVSENDIRDALRNIAVISSIDFVNKNTRPIYDIGANTFKMAFIHLEKWICRQTTVHRFIMKVNDPDGLKIYYDDTHYFILRENLNPSFKKESRINELENENASLYKEIRRLKLQVENITSCSVKLDAIVPRKKRLRNKKNNKKPDLDKDLDKDLDDYLYITTDDEDDGTLMVG